METFYKMNLLVSPHLLPTMAKIPRVVPMLTHQGMCRYALLSTLSAKYSNSFRMAPSSSAMGVSTPPSLYRDASIPSYLTDIIKKFVSGFSLRYSSVPYTQIGSLYRFFLPLCKPPKGFEHFYQKSEREKLSNKLPPPEQDPRKPNRRPFFSPSSIFWISLYIFLFFLWTVDISRIKNETTFKEFLNDYVAKGYVERIQVVNREFCRVILRKDAPTPMETIGFRVGSVDSLESRLEQFQAMLGLPSSEFVPVQYVQEVSVLDEARSLIPYALILLTIGFFLQRGSSGGLGNPLDGFLKDFKAKPVTAKDLKTKVKFADVAGMKEAKAEITEFVDFLKDPEKFESLGARLPRGALLCGPPGGGKTLLAKAVAGEANVPFFSMSGSDFIQVFVGVGPSRVRDLFAQAKKSAPSIVFIDEIDAVGRRRSRGGFAGGANDERENTLNQILVEMDGFSTSSGVVVLAGTNRADILDPALTRPGRFDRTVNIEKPDLEDRQQIFMIHLKPIKLAPLVEAKELSKRLAALTPGFTGADIANICNEGAIQAARRHAKEGVDLRDFELAAERVLGGLPKEHSLLTDSQRKAVAYHETGHALVGWFMEHADPVLKVSIMPRTGKVLGFAQSLPDESLLFTKEALLDRLCVILGGRAAEELFIGRITTGATDDLNKVTQMAYAFVSQWGMNSEVGLVSYQKSNQSEAEFYKPFSESLAQVIDQEVKALIDSQYERVKKLLSDKADVVHKMAQLLYEKETLTYHDIVACVGNRPFEMPKQLESYVKANPPTAIPKAETVEQKQETDSDALLEGEIREKEEKETELQNKDTMEELK